jgi:translocation and assembly module TamB
VPWRSADPIALRISGQADAALANTALQGQLLTGRMKLDADLGGTLGAPQIEGTATLVGGTFTDHLKGIRLSGIEGQVTGRGDTLMIERFTAATRNRHHRRDAPAEGAGRDRGGRPFLSWRRRRMGVLR